MKYFFYILIVFSVCNFMSCLLPEAKLAGYQQIIYYVEYSPDSTFSYIAERKEFYNRISDKYYLKPEQIDCAYWMNHFTGFGYHTERYERIVGSFNDSLVIISPVHYHKFSGCILRVERYKP